jgi:Flp pilus assembly pilin Flp
MAKMKRTAFGLISLFELADSRRPVAEEEGQTVTEYAVVLSVLIIALGGVVFALQGEIASFIDKVATELAGILS